jgi:hypothetical protein
MSRVPSDTVGSIGGGGSRVFYRLGYITASTAAGKQITFRADAVRLVCPLQSGVLGCGVVLDGATTLELPGISGEALVRCVRAGWADSWACGDGEDDETDDAGDADDDADALEDE